MKIAEQNWAKCRFSGRSEDARLRVDPAVLNLAHLAQYTSDDAMLERELLVLFKDHASLQFAKVETASCNDDWAMAVHTLKGSARSIGAGQVASLAAELESVGFAGPGTDKQLQTRKLMQAVARCLTSVETLL